MTGHRGAPLPRKLGVKPGHRVSPVNASQNQSADGRDPEPYDVIVKAALRSGFPRVRERPALRFVHRLAGR